MTSIWNVYETHRNGTYDLRRDENKVIPTCHAIRLAAVYLYVQQVNLSQLMLNERTHLYNLCRLLTDWLTEWLSNAQTNQSTSQPTSLQTNQSIEHRSSGRDAENIFLALYGSFKVLLAYRVTRTRHVSVPESYESCSRCYKSKCCLSTLHLKRVVGSLLLRHVGTFQY
jgi:hypothetical protein